VPRSWLDDPVTTQRVFADFPVAYEPSFSKVDNAPF
jgi:hypothetical protein